MSRINTQTGLARKRSVLRATLLALTSLAAAGSNEHKEVIYDGYKVLRVHAQSMDQLLYLQKLSEMEDTGTKINFWSEPSRLNSSVDVMVSPDFVSEMQTKFEKHNLTAETLINDVGR